MAPCAFLLNTRWESPSGSILHQSRASRCATLGRDIEGRHYLDLALVGVFVSFTFCSMIVADSCPGWLRIGLCVHSPGHPPALWWRCLLWSHSLLEFETVSHIATDDAHCYACVVGSVVWKREYRLRKKTTTRVSVFIGSLSTNYLPRTRYRGPEAEEVSVHTNEFVTLGNLHETFVADWAAFTRVSVSSNFDSV